MLLLLVHDSSCKALKSLPRVVEALILLIEALSVLVERHLTIIVLIG
jgi:hypothetical protein